MTTTDFEHLDLQGFAREIEALRVEEESRLGIDDYHHLRRRARVSRALSVFGYATGWICPNPVSALAMSLGHTSRFCIVAHHVMHKSMDRIPGVPERFTSRGFAKGTRRYLDWLDFIHPTAWDIEHNVLHHYSTGELTDPDLVEENVSSLKDASPLARWAAVGLYALTWKLTYYAPSTFQILRRGERRKASGAGGDVRDDARANEPYHEVFDPRRAESRDFYVRCFLPYALTRYVALPAAFGVLGPWASFSILANTAMAEVLGNLHTFAIIAPNHAGDDMYRFEDAKRGRPEFFLRQVLSSVNFQTGGAVTDFLLGYLNYQIEHHLFPTLPPSSLERLQPKVRAVCESYGVPYVQESLGKRVKKLVDIMVGKTRMPRTDTKRAGTAHASGSVAPELAPV